MSSGVQWFEIYVDDLSRARHFYTSVLGCEFELITNGAIELAIFQPSTDFLSCPGALLLHPMRKPSSEGTIIYFTVNNLGEIENRILDAGGKIHLSRRKIPSRGAISLASDSEGNTIGLFTTEC